METMHNPGKHKRILKVSSKLDLVEGLVSAQIFEIPTTQANSGNHFSSKLP